MRAAASFQLHHLNSVILPRGLGLRRKSILKPDAEPEDFALGYDFDTLIYHATFLKNRRRIVLVCPRLLNLSPLVTKGTFRSSAGRHAIRRHRRFRRHEEIWLQAESCPEDLVLEAGDLRLAIPVSPPDETLAGLRVVTTKSRNNRLEWISDWARHYVRHQGAEAVLLFDNGSTDYHPRDVLDTLADVPGLSAAVVVSVPLAFGPMGVKPPMGRALFLQCGLLNVTRHHYALGMKSLIHCDIDELAVSDSGSLFEAAEASWLGYATAPALWRYPGTGPNARPRHADHRLRAASESGTKEKWAIVPRGRLGQLVWDCHGVSRYEFNRLARRNGHRFLHCAGITTSWKGARGPGQKAGLVEDETLPRLFS